MSDLRNRIWYWTGGEEDGKWNEVLVSTIEQAEILLLTIRRGGLVAHMDLGSTWTPRTMPTTEEFREVLNYWR